MELTVSCLPEMAAANTITVLGATSEAKSDRRKHRTIWIGHVAGSCYLLRPRSENSWHFWLQLARVKGAQAFLMVCTTTLLILQKTAFLLGAEINHLTRQLVTSVCLYAFRVSLSSVFSHIQPGSPVGLSCPHRCVSGPGNPLTPFSLSVQKGTVESNESYTSSA